MGSDRDRKVRGTSKQSPWGKPKSREGRCEVAELPALGGLIDRILNAGDALMFARTSDGGAVVVTLYAGEARHKTYAADQNELNDAWAALAEAYPDEAR